ncbi:MAG: hypothetical protein II754_02140 [Lachnospiraceae bacterium]|nr:hypothetical protein [Lachnospiraceae bacterium]
MSEENIQIRQRSASISNLRMRHNLLEEQANAVPLPQELVQPQQEVELRIQAAPGKLTGREVFQTYSTVFTETKEDGRSAEFLEVKRALSAIADDEGAEGVLPLTTQIFQGNLKFGTDQYGKFLRLEEALSLYLGSHKYATSTAGIERLQAAYLLRRLLSVVAETMLKENNALPKEKKAGEVSRERQKEAAENTVRMLKYYRKYTEKISKDMTASHEEKLQSRWNVLKTCEKDILIFLGSMDASHERDRLYLKNEYKSLRMQLSLCRLARSKGGDDALKTDLADKIRQKAYHELYDEEAPEKEEYKVDSEEETISKEQEKGLSEIDAWVLRNINNGGYMSFGLNTSNRTDVATQLLALPKRQRLYIYYLVETRERIAPKPDGLAKSQMVYVPNLKKFKKHMIPAGTKFYTRFSGSYIYWGKLSEAMGIARSAEDATALMDELKREKKNPQQNAPVVQGPLTREEMRIQSLKKLLANLMETIELKVALEKEKGATKRAETEAKINMLSMDRIALTAEFEEIQQRISAARGKSKANSEDELKTYIGTASKDASKVFGIGRDMILMNTHMEKAVLNGFQKYSGVAVNSLSGLGTLMGFVFSALKLYRKHSKMTNLDFIGGLGDTTRSLVSIGRTASLIGATFSGSGIFKYLSTKTVGNALGYAGAGLAAVKGMSYLKDGSRRKRASKLAKCYETDKYKEGMLRLNRVLGKMQRTGTILETLTASTSIAVPSLIAASVLTAGFGIGSAAVLFGVSIAQKVIDTKFYTRMKNAINDAFFGLDELVRDAETDYKAKHNNQEMPAKKKELLKKQIRRRMARELGFYSTNHMARSVAEKYAAYLLDGAVGDDEFAKMCRAMIRGLGLSYKHYENHPEKNVPTISDIVGKMCG